jgi:hypothetical protein
MGAETTLARSAGLLCAGGSGADWQAAKAGARNPRKIAPQRQIGREIDGIIANPPVPAEPP